MDPRDLRRSAGDLFAKGRYAQAEVLLRQLLLQRHDGDLKIVQSCLPFFIKEMKAIDLILYDIIRVTLQMLNLRCNGDILL